ncbi:WxL domain-containing protein [Carnobacterium maltaromaticum]|uniref:WxL domain-containing protein n=1 Tax=Carnobacterium maltaromaticum TaxID=2751 RepID=UPI0039B067F6
MKVLNLATVGLLSATILTGGITAFAEEAREVQTEGQIIFTPNTDEETEVIPPEMGPDAPDVEIDPEVPGSTGPLTIAKAATMNFGSQVISNQDQTYNMVAEMQKLANPVADGPTHVPYVSFAQVQDTRGTNAGWDLKVSLDNFTSTTQNGVLTGAEVSLHDPRIQYVGNDTNAPKAHENGLKLIPGEGAISVMTAENSKGAGSSSVVWGNQADLNAQFANNEVDVVENGAIQLFVPGSTAKDAATYTSTLSWELAAIPGAGGEDA